MAGPGSKKQNFMHGAAILTIGVIIMKILGAIYKIPLGNILGDEGYSMFISAYSIYNIFFILTTAGLPIALSRMIAEADAHGRRKQEVRLFRVALVTFAVIGLVFSLILFFGSDWLAAKYLENPDASLSVRAMAPAIMLVCLVSAFRGYCQGNGNMIPTTVDEVLEVLFKVVAGLILSTAFLKAGKGLPLGSAGAILGVSVGGIVSLAYMVIYKKKNYSFRLAENSFDADADAGAADPALKIVKDLLRISIPIALGSCIMAILNSVDSKLCMNRLQSAAGFTYREAKVLYGVYGKAQTLFNLPAAFITPLTISIVPAIAGALSLNEREKATGITEDSLRISAVISLPMGAGLAVLSFAIMNLLYPNSHEAGPGLLSIMGIASFFVCIVLMENAVLQASGKERLPMYSMVTGSLVKIAINWFLVANRSINIYGAPVGTLCGYVTMAVMNYVFMCTSLPSRPRLGKIFLRPLICTAAMSAAAAGAYSLLGALLGTGSRIGLVLCTCASIAAAAVVYLLVVIFTRAVTAEDMNMIPGGAKIGKLLHMK